MEPTLGEYTSKMRVGQVRQNLADGAAPLGLETSHASKITLTLIPSRYLSLSPSTLASHQRPTRGRQRPLAPADRTPPAGTAGPASPARAAGLEAHGAGRAGAGDRVGPHAAGLRGGQGNGQDRSLPALPAGSFPGRVGTAPPGRVATAPVVSSLHRSLPLLR